MDGLTIGTVDKLFLDFSGDPDSAQKPPAWGDPPVAYHLLWDRVWDAHGCGSACPDTSAEQVWPQSQSQHVTPALPASCSGQNMYVRSDQKNPL